MNKIGPPAEDGPECFSEGREALERVAFEDLVLSGSVLGELGDVSDADDLSALALDQTDHRRGRPAGREDIGQDDDLRSGEDAFGTHLQLRGAFGVDAGLGNRCSRESSLVPHGDHGLAELPRERGLFPAPEPSLIPNMPIS